MRGVIGKYPSSDGNGEVIGANGIIKANRKCRDIVFLVFFIAFWISMIVNSSFGFNQGNPLRLNFGLDYKGNVCGGKHKDFNLHELELKYYVNPNQVYQSGVKNSGVKLANARTICLLDCPTPSEDSLKWVCDYPEGDIRISLDDWIDMDYDYFADLTPELRNTSLQLQVYWTCQFIDRPSNVSLTHWKQMNGVTIDDNMVIDKSIHNSINARSSVLKRYVADVGKSWPVLIVCGGLLPLFLSLLWLLMIRHFVAAMPWVTVFFFNGLIISVTMFYYLKAGWIGNDAISPIIGEHDPYYHVSAREQHHIRAAAFLMTCVMIVAVLSSIAIVRRILMATSVLKASCCKGDWRSSCSNNIPGRTPAMIATQIAVRMILKPNGSVVMIAVTTIPFLPVVSSMKLLIRYSLGSVAIGSLIVSFVESTRFILEAVRRRLKVADIMPENWFKRMMFYTSRACLKCIELTVKSVNRNAYIMIAITGKGFFRASEMATDLIISNILRIGRVNVIGDVILFLGKLCVSLASALFGFLMLDTHKYKSSHNKITSPLFPVLVCWGLGYVVATLFFAVVEMSIDTIILSYCQDAEEHQGTAHYAPPLLIETFDEQHEVQRIAQ
ncbi:hypothetical protein M8C21_018623 [Ambrosia artemisiifolia]|uniref:Choline transporter-like protein n=1 Tax=Ambrosia artemisiifolia TaxID=4212 RepID=A0AAD5C3J0_AMBAR|nr:hypothetical protein M8C21_018623 [Ambrosia artemisiifolia]